MVNQKLVRQPPRLTTHSRRDGGAPFMASFRFAQSLPRIVAAVTVARMETNVAFAGRLKLAWQVLVDGGLAARLLAGAKTPAPVAPAPAPGLPPERVHASGLFVLGALQREGRLVDFLRQEVAGFSDADVGAAARVIHAGCRKVLEQYVTVAPVLKEAEGEAVTVAAGFDAQRIRLTGSVAGQPPFRGTLRHHGWVATEIKFPAVQASLDPRVLAPAEVEMS